MTHPLPTPHLVTRRVAEQLPVHVPVRPRGARQLGQHRRPRAPPRTWRQWACQHAAVGMWLRAAGGGATQPGPLDTAVREVTKGRLDAHFKKALCITVREVTKAVLMRILKALCITM